MLCCAQRTDLHRLGYILAGADPEGVHWVPVNPPFVLNNGLLLTHIHYGVEFDEDQIISEFARKQPRRMELVDILQQLFVDRIIREF